MPYPGVINLSVEPSEPDRTTVLLTGELSDAIAPALARSLMRLIVRANRATPPRQTLVVDLAGIGTYTRGGVSALCHARRFAHEIGIDLQLTGLDGRWPLLPQQVAHDLLALGTSTPTSAQNDLRSQDDLTAGAAASRPGPQLQLGSSPLGRRTGTSQTVTGRGTRPRPGPPLWTASPTCPANPATRPMPGRTAI